MRRERNLLAIPSVAFDSKNPWKRAIKGPEYLIKNSYMNDRFICGTQSWIGIVFDIAVEITLLSFMTNEVKFVRFQMIDEQLRVHSCIYNVL